jgi:hypothetical protein
MNLMKMDSHGLIELNSRALLELRALARFPLNSLDVVVVGAPPLHQMSCCSLVYFVDEAADWHFWDNVSDTFCSSSCLNC